MRAAVDVMGGDRAPTAILEGCYSAASDLAGNDRLLLVGDEAIIRRSLDEARLTPDARERFTVIPATQTIAMDESPAVAIRGKPDSSIAVMCRLVASGDADVCISAGNTGACVAAAQLRMRVLPGVSRPGIAVVLPTAAGPVVLCDAGANPTPKATHLLQYAIMAGAYAKSVCGIASPRVGLLSIGEEDAKGTPMVKQAHQLLRDEPQVRFIGNVEGKDLFRGACDVVVCDGFVGNTILKTAEGFAEGLMKSIQAELKQTNGAATALLQAVLKRVFDRHDWEEYGGAPLLGVAGYCLICHGRSEARAIRNAIHVSARLVSSRLNPAITEHLARSIPVGED